MPNRSLLAIVSLVAVAVSALGCVGGRLNPKAQRAVDTFDCAVAVVSPYVGDALDVTELVTDAIKGRASIPEALRMLGATADDVQAVRGALASCVSQPDPAPLEPEPSDYRATAGAP
jgi:hypothetical protein